MAATDLQKWIEEFIASIRKEPHRICLKRTSFGKEPLVIEGWRVPIPKQFSMETIDGVRVGVDTYLYVTNGKQFVVYCEEHINQNKGAAMIFDTTDQLVSAIGESVGPQLALKKAKINLK